MRSKNILNYIILCSTLISEIHCLSFISRDLYNLTLQVSTSHGLVQGKEEITKNGTSFFFYSIPYATPPLQSLRFKSPQPMKKWKGVLDATKIRSSCVELQMKAKGRLLRRDGTEDCLYINVFTPVTHGRTKLPVIVYIYGGGYMEGNSVVYHPDYLVEKDIIVVTFNYRAGIFGFLSTEDEASYGNYGLKDQLAALKWTNANIKKFGGDPDKVTIAGHSAGSFSVNYMMLNLRSQGLYSAAICMSGTAISPQGIQKNPRTVAFDIGLSLGIKTQNSTELVEKLREMDIDDLAQAQEAKLFTLLPELADTGLPFTPVVEKEHEDAFITKPPIDLMKNGEFVRVPVMMGMTDFEISTISGMIPRTRPIMLLFDIKPNLFPDILGVESVPKRIAVAQKLRKKYTKSDSYFLTTNEERMEIFNDLLYTRPITITGMMLSKYIPVYFYVFEYPLKSIKIYIKDVYGLAVDLSLYGVGHVEDIFYIWKYNDFELPPEGFFMRDRILKFWSNFARYRNPTPTRDPLLQNVVWPLLNNSEDVTYLEIGRDLEVSKNFRMDYVNFLNDLAENPED